MDENSQENLIDPDEPRPATVAELLDGLSDFDLSADDHKRYGQTPADSRRAVVEAWQEGHADAKQRNKKKGHKAQRNKGIDAYRAGDGKADYNVMRRLTRQAKAEAEGRPFRPRAPRGQTSPDAKSNAQRQADLRAAMTVAQKKDESRKRQERRQKARDRIAAALKDGALF
ncbi:hypothetical protein EN978_07175 [Mesorhizobium sp. M7A.F.Ca.US.001.04.1.1]|uniref:hypothetical protein n=1 Tax=unclassified Mesorhizobium TaxID=325217 RepID=UPI000FC9C617|nr:MULTISPECIES: hypothetical protein [unclassified Mesorhizobium]RUY31705.1 hypothetical protein EN979_02105 [Mesorhizobium sp. M7A.F.Ca.US.001.04.2.1]RUY44107.1 hypothetical protein EN978_07175 [Mesorhizobium sp. M7A.F.Ca.US.001.04.1.1]